MESEGIRNRLLGRLETQFFQLFPDFAMEMTSRFDDILDFVDLLQIYIAMFDDSVFFFRLCHHLSIQCLLFTDLFALFETKSRLLTLTLLFQAAKHIGTTGRI